ncbi:MAG: hypothetical protein ACM3KR_01060 [Deltaproteobacteria bacterium]
MIELIKIKLKLHQAKGILFHDSRHDVNELGEAINVCIKKINEIVNEVNRLKTNAFIAEIKNKTLAGGKQ